MGLGGGGETGGEEAVGDLGIHGFGARAGLALLSVAGEGWETTQGCAWIPGLGAMGGGEGLAVAGSLGLGANGGFFTPGRTEEGEESRQSQTLFTQTSCNMNHTAHKTHFIHASAIRSVDSCTPWLRQGSQGRF